MEIKNIAFVIWMLGWPLILMLGSHWDRMDGVWHEPSGDSCLCWLLIYIIIAIYTYE